MTRRSFLSDFFRGVAVKKLSSVEIDTRRSNQHEFNGVSELKLILGTEEPVRLPARFLWIGQDHVAKSESGFLTWYDARRDHPTRSEYRLYFPTTVVSQTASAGDTLFIAKLRDGSLLIVMTPAGGTIEVQLLWLFGLPQQPQLSFIAQEVATAELDFAARYILDELEIEPPADEGLDSLIESFGLQFPTTAEMSQLARSSLPEIDPVASPDSALLAWVDREEQLFRRLERKIVSKRLAEGFMTTEGGDVDGFLAFSLSVQNRRKARMGAALENHVDALFRHYRIQFERGATTENRAKPDFLFPGSTEYHDASFPPDHLTMLGAKSTCKDRWRQVLSEAERIPNKHLLTLEPGISANQTSEMKANRLKLVLPKPLHKTFNPEQQAWLMDLSSFISHVQGKCS